MFLSQPVTASAATQLFSESVVPTFYRVNDTQQPNANFLMGATFQAGENPRVLTFEDSSYLNLISDDNLRNGIHNAGILGPWPSRSQLKLGLYTGPSLTPTAGVIGFLSGYAKQVRSQVQVSLPSPEVWQSLSSSVARNGVVGVTYDKGQVRVSLSALLTLQASDDAFEIDAGTSPELGLCLSIPSLDPYFDQFSWKKLDTAKSQASRRNYDALRDEIVNAGLAVFQELKSAGVSVELVGDGYALNAAGAHIDTSGDAFSRLGIRGKRVDVSKAVLVYDPKSDAKQPPPPSQTASAPTLMVDVASPQKRRPTPYFFAIDLTNGDHMRPIRSKVVELLKEATESELRKLAQDAGIDVGYMQFGDPAAIVAHNLVSEVRNYGVTDLFLSLLGERYGFRDWPSLISKK